VIGVWVGENDPVYRLVEAARVSGRLIGVGTQQLSVEDDELRWPFVTVPPRVIVIVPFMRSLPP